MNSAVLCALLCVMCAVFTAASAAATTAPATLTLDAAIDTALARSPAYVALVNDVELARLDLESARGAFRTRFTSVANTSDRTGADLGSTYEMGLQRLTESGSRWGLGFASSSYGDQALSELKLSYSLPFFGNPAAASRYAVDLAEIEAERRERVLAVGAEELTVQVVAGYYDAVLAANRVAVAQSARDLAQALALVTSVREHAGTSTALDSKRARLRVNEAEQHARVSSMAVERARQRLAALIGIPVDSAFTVRDEVPAIDIEASFQMNADALEERAIERRPELVGMREEIAVFRRRARDAGGRLPPLDVSLQFSLVGEGANVGDSFALDEQRFGVGINVALDQGHARDLERRRWMLQYESRRQSYLAVENQVRFEARDAALNFEESLGTARIAEQQLMLSDEQFRYVELKYRSGSATTEEALDAEQALADARLAELERRVAFWIAKHRLDQVAGTGTRDAHTRKREEQQKWFDEPAR